MKNARCLDRSEIRLDLAWGFPKDKVGAMDVRDAVEDSATAEEMVRNLNKLKPYNRFSLDRVTKDYARVVAIDTLGNRIYIKADF